MYNMRIHEIQRGGKVRWGALPGCYNAGGNTANEFFSVRKKPVTFFTFFPRTYAMEFPHFLYHLACRYQLTCPGGGGGGGGQRRAFLLVQKVMDDTFASKKIDFLQTMRQQYRRCTFIGMHIDVLSISRVQAIGSTPTGGAFAYALSNNP